MILWCFNPINTTHLFILERLAPFGRGVMTRLYVQTTVLAFLFDNLCTIRQGIFITLKGIEITIENLILDDQVHTFSSENETMSKLHCQ